MTCHLFSVCYEKADLLTFSRGMTIAITPQADKPARRAVVQSNVERHLASRCFHTSHKLSNLLSSSHDKE